MGPATLLMSSPCVLPTSRPPLTSSPSRTSPTTLTSPATTSSLTGPSLSTRPSSATVAPRATPRIASRSSRRPTPLQSTGSPLVPSVLSRTRASAVHAELSAPPAPSRVPTSSPLVSSSPSLSSSSLIAPTESTATTLATVASRPTPTTTTRPATMPSSSPSTPTLVRSSLANTTHSPRPPSPYPPTLMLPPTTQHR